MELQDKIKRQISELEAQRDRLQTDANTILQARLAEVRAAVVAEINATLTGYQRQITALEELLNEQDSTET